MCAACFHYRAAERGAALVLALLIVALVAALAVQFAEVFRLNTARVENRWHGVAAQNYLEGAESLASIVLQQDLQESENDHLLEVWAQEAPPFATDDGVLIAQLEDAQARFNLNNLDGTAPQAQDPTAPPPARFTPEQRAFVRLLQTFDDYPLREDEAVAIAEAVIDWIDSDDEPRGFGGAESLHYSNQDPPYEANNSRRFHSVSELRLVRHMTPDLYKRLEPLLVALPQQTSINVNTMSLQMMRILNAADTLQPLRAEDVEPLVEDREVQQYDALDDFFSSPILQTVAPDAEHSGFGVATGWFFLHARATVGEQERFLVSLLQRDDGKVRTVQRRYTSY